MQARRIYECYDDCINELQSEKVNIAHDWISCMQDVPYNIAPKLKGKIISPKLTD